MRIYEMFPLARDHSVRYSAIGNTAQLSLPIKDPSIKYTYPGQTDNKVIIPVGFEWDSAVTGSFLDLDLYKSVEIGHDVVALTPIVAERYWVRNKDEYLPYKVRYRHVNSDTMEAYIYPRNIARFWKDRTGASHYTFQTPVETIAEAISYTSGTCNEAAEAYLQLHKDHAVLPFLQEDYRSIASAERRLTKIASIFNEHRYDVNSALDWLAPIVLPISDVEGDETFCRWKDGPISGKKLAQVRAVQGSLFLDPPETEIIKHPEWTLLSHPYLSVTSTIIDRVLATDLDLEYISSNGKIHTEIVHHAVDRYATVVRPGAHADDSKLCRDAASSALNAAVHAATTPEQHRLFFDDLRITLKKSFSDEVVITIRRADSDKNSHPETAFHIDLAMLPLCSYGLSVL